jgi:hypothetical protein
MSLSSPLSVKQQAVWGMLRRGLSPGQVADELQSSRQYVHQVAVVAEAKIAKTLMEVAQSAHWQVRRMDATNGVLLAYDPALRSNIVITYTNKNGVRIWHWYERVDEIKDLSYMEEVREYLLNEVEERNLKLSAEEKRLHPAKLAQLVFSRLLPELGA